MKRSKLSRTLGLLAKRAIDVGVAGGGLIVLSPILGAAALAIYATMGRPIIFAHVRPGYGGKPFTLRKLRTMRPAEDATAYLLTDTARLTPVGRFLRRTSIDELPELWHVLTGEMSLVGPRPLLLEYLPYLSPRERLRMQVRPGITGWAQINGRNLSPWDERLENDVWYVEHWSVWLDFRILMATLGKVVRGSEVVADPRSVMLNLDEERVGKRHE